MKAENTIKKTINRLRQFIDDNIQSRDLSIKCAVSDAYEMENCLNWVLYTCSWTPLSILGEKIHIAREQSESQLNRIESMVEHIYSETRKR